MSKPSLLRAPKPVDFWSADAIQKRQDHLGTRIADILKEPFPDNAVMAKVRREMNNKNDKDNKPRRSTENTNLGAVVRLIAGGPLMTVTGHSPEGPWLEVVWISSDDDRLQSMRAPYASFIVEAP